MSKHKNVRWFKSQRIDFSSTEKVDKEKGVLEGVILCQVGEAKGHGVHLEQSFIDDCAAYANQNHTSKGMKSRFGHPSMSNETLGSELGRFNNFRVDGEQLKADLHLLESANLSPNNPGLKDWMMSMAEEDPSMIMCSIVFKPKYEYQYDADDNRVNIYFNDEQGNWHRCRNKDGVSTPFDDKKKVFVENDQLHFCDIVDQGAATDKLFSEQFNSDKFSVICTQFLNDNPKIDEFLKENPEKLFSFIEGRHQSVDPTDDHHELSFFDKMKVHFETLFTAKNPKIESNQDNKDNMKFEKSLGILDKEAPSAAELAEVKAEITEFTIAQEKFTAEEVASQVETAVTAKEKELGEQAQEITSLNEKVKELELASTPPKTPKKDGNDDLGEGAEEATEFNSFDHNKEAMNEIKEL